MDSAIQREGASRLRQQSRASAILRTAIAILPFFILIYYNKNKKAGGLNFLFLPWRKASASFLNLTSFHCEAPAFFYSLARSAQASQARSKWRFGGSLNLKIK
jgi:hypothetical protein